MKPFTHRRTRLAIIIAGLLMLGSIVVYSYATSKKTPEETIAVKRGTVTELVSTTGAVKPAEHIDLAFEQSGKVARVTVEVGQTVAAGQPLIELDASELAAQLREATAHIDAERAKLAELERGTRPEELLIAETKAANARIALENAERGLADSMRDAYTKADDAIRNKTDQFFANSRTQNPQLLFHIASGELQAEAESLRRTVETSLTAWATNLAELNSATALSALSAFTKNRLAEVSSFLNILAFSVNGATADTNTSQSTLNSWRADVSTARTNVNTATTNLSAADEKLRTAAAALELANNELALARAGATPEQIGTQRALAREAEANEALIRAKLSKTVLRSPLRGIVTREDARVGEIVAANETIAAVIDLNRVKLETNVPEADIAKAHVGDTARVTFDAFGSARTFIAHVAAIDPAESVIEGVATYKVTLAFADAPEELKPGMTANIDIVTAEKNDVLFIPERALVAQNGGHTATIRGTDGAQRTEEVTTGIRGSDGMIEITSGLSENDAVILHRRP